MKLQLKTKRNFNKEKEIVCLINKINSLNKAGNITGFWKIVKTINKNNIFKGIKELYDENNNTIISNEGIKQIINNHIRNEFHINIDNKYDIFKELKQIEESIHIDKNANELLKEREILHPS